MSLKNHYYCIMSGLFGSLASMFGKLMNHNLMENDIEQISCVKHHRCLYDHSDQNYKNSVYVDKAWQSVAKDFGENVTDCKKKWRHLRSSLSRYLKSSKDIAKNKNNKLKPYYLLQHMDFLVPYTKTLEIKTEGIINKFETTDENEGYADLKSEDATAYDQEIIQEESQSMEEDEDIVYETFEIQEQPQNQKSQITLVRSSHPSNPQTTTIPQLQPIQPLINTINTMSSSVKQPAQTLQLNSSTQISQIAQQQQQQQQQHSPGSSVNMQTQQQSIPLQNTIIPISDDQSSADLNFFLALLPDIKSMNLEQKRRLRIGTLKLIDEILGSSH